MKGYQAHRDKKKSFTFSSWLFYWRQQRFQQFELSACRPQLVFCLQHNAYRFFLSQLCKGDLEMLRHYEIKELNDTRGTLFDAAHIAETDTKGKTINVTWDAQNACHTYCSSPTRHHHLTARTRCKEQNKKSHCCRCREGVGHRKNNKTVNYEQSSLTFKWPWISLAFRRAKTWMWLDTCLRDRLLPVRSLMYLAINSLRPGRKMWHQAVCYRRQSCVDRRRLGGGWVAGAGGGGFTGSVCVCCGCLLWSLSAGPSPCAAPGPAGGSRSACACGSFPSSAWCT